MAFSKSKPAGLHTTNECKAFVQGVHKELVLSHAMAKSLPLKARDLHKNNSYFGYFRKAEDPPVSFEHPYTFDKVKDSTPADQSISRDTFHPKHTEASRKRCKVPLSTQWQIRSSQAYGWLPPIDEPNMGFGRSSIFYDSSMDKSHLTVKNMDAGR
mmetsp:Transcript_32064/g.70125  ORF Transcript_32064/g.70125 Transcript_32064/m.70125 type:complete len:156 (-) Transcript_32064:101-568(-)